MILMCFSGPAWAEAPRVVASIKPVTNGPALGEETARTTLPMETSKSSIEWVALKNGSAEVKGKFTALAGSLSIDAKDLRTATGEIGIDLLGISTGDEARDGNIASIFFGSTKKEPVHGQFSVTSMRPEKLTLAVGETTRAQAQVGFNLGGDAIGGVLPFEIERVGTDYWRITILEPLTVGIDEMGMQDRAAALIKACAHESIGNGITATGTAFFGTPS